MDVAELKKAVEYISRRWGVQSAYNVLLRSEVALGVRKPSLALYDHTGHIIGGGQKYGFTAAHALQELFDVTLIVNRPVTHENIKEWYHLDLGACKIKIIDIPFFNTGECFQIDPGRVNRRIPNPFHIISRESGNYDFFINNSMNEKVCPLSNISALICHFPERRPKDYFYAHRYTYVIYNSNYTAHWIREKWKFSPHCHIYPPVDMAPCFENDLAPKQNIILSVARFEAGGSKKQQDMVRTFIKLNRRFPDLFRSWTLILAGGSPDENDYLKSIKDTIQKSGLQNIDMKLNITGDELKTLYKKASIFWHLCGLDHTDPALIEHFGMTIVEAMQNRLAPIVYDGGGQREIVEHGVSGFRVRSTAELIAYTLKIIQDSALCQKIGNQAFDRSQCFTRDVFEKKVIDFFSRLLRDYRQL